MKYNGIYTIISTTFPFGHKILVVVKEREREAKAFLFSCYIKKRLTRCFIERNWDCKDLWTNLGVVDEQYIKRLEEVDKLTRWYEI